MVVFEKQGLTARSLILRGWTVADHAFRPRRYGTTASGQQGLTRAVCDDGIEFNALSVRVENIGMSEGWGRYGHPPCRIHYQRRRR